MKKRKDGRYQAKVYVGTDDGKPQYKYVYGLTQKEVKAAAAELKAQMGKGIDITADKSFSHWCELWLDHIQEEQAVEEFQRKKSRLEYFTNRFGNRDITTINAADLEQAFFDLKKLNPYTNKPSSAKTLTGYKSVVAAVFGYCAKCRILTFNPTTDIDVQKIAKTGKITPKSKRKALTDEQLQKIRETPHICQTLALLMSYGGLRLGEAIVFGWNDADFENDELIINKSYNSKTHEIKLPKTEAGIRTAPMPRVLKEHLLSLPRESTLVTTNNGKQWNQGTVEKAWQHYCDELGFDFLRHECRHTFVTLMFEAGVDEMLCISIVGHKDGKMVHEIYCHLREEYKRKEYKRIIAALK